MDKCFGIRMNRCKVLNVSKCNENSCSFFKTKEQFEDDRKKSINRINSLDECTRSSIIDTYYGGRLDIE